MKTLNPFIQYFLTIFTLGCSTSVLAHKGEHAEVNTLTSIASHFSHLLSEAGHVASIAVIAIAGLVLAKVIKKIFSQAIQAKPLAKKIVS